MKEYYHHNHYCSHRKMPNCDCSRGSCSSNSCCCDYRGHQDKRGINLIKEAKFMLEKAFYQALMKDQVERIKDMILDDEEMDETLEKTANLIIKVMKKQWQEGVLLSESSEELDHELEKIFRRNKDRKKEDEEDDKKI